MVNLVKKFKSFIPLNTKIFFSYLKNFNHIPYSLESLINPDPTISDFFIYDRDCLSVGFIAENIRAILLGYEVPITHNFKFFSKEGFLLDHQTFKTNDFFHKIRFNKIKCDDKYISFIHYVSSDLKLNQIIRNVEKSKILNFSEQNRGYTIYYPFNLDTGSVVHGNFGGISKNLKKSARQTFRKHIYTPIYKFKEDCKYDLVFNNPTPKIIDIKIIFNNCQKVGYLKIPSMGTRNFPINNFVGSVSFISKLPICRALVFKNPTKNLKGNFDVFHS